ncbi:CBO0543 family protein [Paenibacillus sp.]|uniref:CBO0543 family protein n=1 Tax=Paenibacillus sp. TaxID=58172 RepID=UPI002D308D69|nr:CBO0543 family protein [Paenibacillus sp.]HZG57490.1 CBO0543 family protein [Paenibacillus sp.]
MHLATAGVVLYALWKWADLSRWRRYHASMLYFSVCNLLYLYLCQDYPLWSLIEDGSVPHHAWTAALYNFFIYPSCVLLFLSRAPRRRTAALWLHVGKWVALFALIEALYLELGLMIHDHGWSLGWSVLFDCIMFPMLLLHQRRPLLAYPLSVLFACGWLLLFDVPARSPFL